MGETLSGGKDLGDLKWFGANYDNATATTTAPASLPVRSSLMVREHPDYGTIQLHPEASADLEVGTLSGRMSAFAEVGLSLGKYEAEKEIYSWRGLHETIPIWLLDSDPVQLAARGALRSGR